MIINMICIKTFKHYKFKYSYLILVLELAHILAHVLEMRSF